MQRNTARYRTLVLSVLAVLVSAPGASAQEAAIAEAPRKLPRWDASGGFGIAFVNSRHFDLEGDPYPYWEPKGELGLQFGRYFTQHLKGEFAISGLSSYDLIDSERIPVAGLPSGGFAHTNRTVRVVELAPTFTYQFFENVFAHPFVSAGVSVGVMSEHRHRAQKTYRLSQSVARLYGGIDAVSYMVPAVDTRRTFVLARPFVAAGFKSYFNGRTFLRPEFRTGFGAASASRMSLRLDVGFDF